MSVPKTSSDNGTFSPPAGVTASDFGDSSSTDVKQRHLGGYGSSESQDKPLAKKAAADEAAAMGRTREAGPDAKVPKSFRELFVTYWHEVITYCAVYWMFGMSVAFLGPTLLDLGCLTTSSMQSLSWVFFAQLLCSMVGASLAGYLVERGLISASVNECDANYILFVASVIIPLSMFIIPFCKVLGALAVVLAVIGINMGFIDTLANLQMINLFGENVPPFLQAMHFCYGLGAFISPMIAEPFLLNEDCSPFIDNVTEATKMTKEQITVDDYINSTSIPAHSLVEAQEMTGVRFAFWIMGAINLPISLLVVSLCLRLRWRGWTPEHRTLIESDSSLSLATSTETRNEYGTMEKADDGDKPLGICNHDTLCCKTPMSQIVAITGLTAMMLFIYDGIQSAYGGYIYSYAVRSIADLDSSEGAYLNALFWGTFALGRLVSVPLATRFSPAFMLMCNIIGCTVSMTFMLILNHDHKALYAGTFLFGMFLSSIAPTAISLAEQYIDVTSTITSSIVVIGATGEMICPVIVGNIFVKLGSISFLYFLEIMCALSIVVFMALYLVGRKTPKEKGRTSCTMEMEVLSRTS